MVQNCWIMKRKLLDASLIIFVATVLIKSFIWLRPWRLPLPSDFSRLINAIMLLSGGLVLSLCLSFLWERIKLPHISRQQVKTTAITLSALAIIVLGIIVLVHTNNTTPSGEVFNQIPTPTPQPSPIPVLSPDEVEFEPAHK
jgi:hypothetical protein